MVLKGALEELSNTKFCLDSPPKASAPTVDIEDITPITIESSDISPNSKNQTTTTTTKSPSKSPPSSATSSSSSSPSKSPKSTSKSNSQTPSKTPNSTNDHNGSIVCATATFRKLVLTFS